jgi:hypothetical protein
MDGHDDSRLLRGERVAASGIALERIKRPERGAPMRSRLTIVALLAGGMLMSGTGTGFAFQDFGQSGNDASKAQYPASDKTPTNDVGRVEALGEPVPPGTPPGEGEGGGGGVTPAGRAGEQLVPIPPPDTQVKRQVEVGSSLPFTGFAAIPAVMLGAALVVTGLALRRRAPGSD